LAKLFKARGHLGTSEDWGTGPINPWLANPSIGFGFPSQTLLLSRKIQLKGCSHYCSGKIPLVRPGSNKGG